MSNDWVPKAFNDMTANGSIRDVDKAAEDMLAGINEAFAPLGVNAAVEKKTVMRKVQGTEMCPKCGKPLEGRVVMAMDQKFHIMCFECSQCARPIEDASFTVRNGEAWCQKCIDWSSEKQVGGAAPKKTTTSTVTVTTTKKTEQKEQDFDALRGFQPKWCSKCNQKILVGVDLDGHSMCTSCFKCYRCKQEINPQEGFMPQGSNYFCAKCFHAVGQPTIGGGPSGAVGAPEQMECASCQQPISGKYLKVDGSIYHKDCFVCDNVKCKKPLTGGYMEKGRKKYCQDCGPKMQDVEYENVPLEKPVAGIRVDPITQQVRNTAKDEHQDANAKKLPKFCFKCGAKCEGNKFCPGCGIKIVAQ